MYIVDKKRAFKNCPVFDLLQKQNIVLKNRFIVSDGRTLRIRKY